MRVEPDVCQSREPGVAQCTSNIVGPHTCIFMRRAMCRTHVYQVKSGRTVWLDGSRLSHRTDLHDVTNHHHVQQHRAVVYIQAVSVYSGWIHQSSSGNLLYMENVERILTGVNSTARCRLIANLLSSRRYRFGQQILKVSGAGLGHIWFLLAHVQCSQVTGATGPRTHVSTRYQLVSGDDVCLT